MNNKKERILIVEDNAVNRQILHGILKSNYEVLEAENGLEALNLLDLEFATVSAILLDVVMPVMDGYRFLKELKNKSYREIPVIIMTGHSEQDSEEKALEAGACDFVTKPFQTTVLLSRLQNAISRSQIRYLKQIQYAAEHDSMTDLYTLQRFFKSAQSVFQKNCNREFLMACMEIDHFSILRSMWGETENSRFLKYTADLLRQVMSVYQCARFCRVSGSCFCFFMEYDVRKLKYTLNSLIGGLSSYNRNFQIEPSIGLYRASNPAIPIERMYLNASIAMDACVNQYHQYTREFEASMSDSLMREQKIINEMETALTQQQFIIYFQPKYNLQTNAPFGAEALVRWNHPEKGLISPGLFIPIFEKNGFIGKLDVYIWDKVCALLRKWIDEGWNPAPVSVNMSRADLYNPNLIDTILELIRKYDLKPELLNLELTESTYMDNPKLMMEKIQILRKLGFCVMMDDFGSAYSSLNMLKDIQVDYLKIDMKFIQGDVHNTRSERVMASVVRMAGWLDLPVIVEGVENKEQYEFLQSIGCSYIQGYYFARPMSVEKYEEFIKGIQQIAFVRQSDIKDAADVLWSSSPELNYFIDALPQPMAIYELEDESFSVLRMNASFKERFGYRVNKEDTERVFHHQLDEKNQEKVLAAFHEAVRIRGIADCEYYRKNLQGNFEHYRMSVRYLGTTEASYILISTFILLKSVEASGDILDRPTVFLDNPDEKSRQPVSIETLKENTAFMSTFNDFVRLIDPADCATVVFTNDGKLKKNMKNCFTVWQKSERCPNCTSYSALETNTRRIKVESIGNQEFLIISMPVTVIMEDTDYLLIIEIMNRISK